MTTRRSKKPPASPAATPDTEVPWHDEVGQLSEDVAALRGIGRALAAGVKELFDAARSGTHRTDATNAEADEAGR